MKKIGLVGGLTWLSTLEYYRLINAGANLRLGRNHSAPLIIESIDRQQFLDAVYTDPTEFAAGNLIIQAFERLSASGAEVFAVCANGIHRFEERIREETGIQIQNIATATAIQARFAELATVGILGVQKTMDSSFFPDAMASQGIKVLLPTESEQQLVHQRIIEEMVKGEFLDTTREEIEAVAKSLQSRGAEAIVMACTEIPLMFKEEKIAEIPALSTTRIHCEAILEAACNE